MSVNNDNLIGGKQSRKVAYALGNIDDPLLPLHLRLHAQPASVKKELPAKFKCPKPDCKETFCVQEELEKHQWQKCHWRCVACELDIPNEDALYLHNSQVHKEPQDLTCPGCGAECDRGSQLVAHVERNHCPRLFASMLHDRRQKQIEFNESLRKMNTANDDFDLVSDLENLKMIGNGSDNRPHTRPDARIPNYMLSTNQSGKPDKSAFDSGNNNDSKSNLLTGDVTKTASQPINSSIEQFEAKWVKGETLFQDAVRPTPRQLEKSYETAPTKRSNLHERITDPDDSRFNAAVFYHPILQQFTCAHAPKCKSKFQYAKGLISHLRSPAHKETVVFKCPRCLRDYKTMAAALAHAESATRICNIRETEDFRKFVDHVTGGMLDGLNGKDECLKDGSPRLIIPKAFYETLPFPAHIRYKQTEQTAKLGRGRIAEWDGPEDHDWGHKAENTHKTVPSSGGGW